MPKYPKLLELFYDSVAPALGLERRDNAALDQSANLAVGDIPVELGDPLVLGGRKGFAVAVGEGEQAPLAEVDVGGAELIEPSQRILVVDRRVAQGDDEHETFGGKLRRAKPVVLHFLKHARHSFAHFAQITEVGQNSHDQRIARKVDAAMLL